MGGAVSIDAMGGAVMLNVALVKSGPGGPLLATKTGPPGPLLATNSGPGSHGGPLLATNSGPGSHGGPLLAIKSGPIGGPVLVAKSLT